MRLRLLERPIVASVLQSSGALAALELASRERSLFVLNYHRLGTIAGNPLDDATFSATAAELRQQMTHLKRWFVTPSVSEILDSLARGRFDDPTALVTFDDGYRDNYDVGFPVLRSLGVPACFFVVSGYLDAPSLPWWDHIAYSVKHTAAAVVTIDYPEPLKFDLRATPPSRVTYAILRAYKRARPLDNRRFFDGLAAATGVDVDGPALSRELFVSWDAAREMRDAGMTIGSHTVTHPILASLPEADQHRELVESRERIGEVLGAAPDVLAYPVGGPTAFTEATKRLARDAGYRAAFSYIGRRNVPGRIDQFAIGRSAVEHDQSHAQFRLNAALKTIALGGLDGSSDARR
jgi:peptidoglycan/xylan/chitin deacetylase (PgdA/CDA1 family)